MTAVDSIYNEYIQILAFLQENKQPSLESDVNKNFKKIILLSSASFFEYEIQNILIEFISKSSNENIKVVNFLKKKAIGMQYHTYFSWGEKNEPNKPGKNANTFFSLFGDDFKNEADNDVKQNKDLDNSIKAFIELGHLRNILVHSNFASYNLENKTTEELYQLYNKAFAFIDYLKNKLI